MKFSRKLPYDILFILFASTLCPFVYRYFNTRSYDTERQDMSAVDGRYTLDEYFDMMSMLTEINLNDPNGHNATLEQFNKLSDPPANVLEIGYGLGSFSVLLAKKYPLAEIVGIDAHILSYEAANSYLNSLPDKPNNVRFEVRNTSSLHEPFKSYDVITTTLVNHHISDDEFIEFLERASKIGRKALIFNDLYRSPGNIFKNSLSLYLLKYLPYDLVCLLGSYVGVDKDLLHIFRPRPGKSLTIDGGILSMRKSYSVQEYAHMFKEAGYPESAWRCRLLNNWNDFTSTGRLTCYADLSWKTEESCESSLHSE